MSTLEVKPGDYVVSKMDQVLGENDIRVDKHEILIVTSTSKIDTAANLRRQSGAEIKKTVIDTGRYRLPYKNEKLWGL